MTGRNCFVGFIGYAPFVVLSDLVGEEFGLEHPQAYDDRLADCGDVTFSPQGDGLIFRAAGQAVMSTEGVSRELN